MVILTFSLCFAAMVIVTRSYRFVDKYYPSILFVSSISMLYTLICRDHWPWHFQTWWFVTDKVSTLIQIFVLFPSTTLLFLRFLPSKKWLCTFFILCFFGIYILMEWFLNQTHEIIYNHGWTFGWSALIDLLLFAFTWLHAKSWKIAWSVSALVIAILIIRFRVPL